MGKLKGESIVLVKVKPGETARAVRDLARSDEISDAQLVLGSYDIVASGAFPDDRALRDFVEKVESKPFCQGCSARPSFEFWEKKWEGEVKGTAWTLIKSNSPSRTMKDLKKLENARKLIWTAGEYNIVASFIIRSPEEWSTTILEGVHNTMGVQSTITLPSLPRQ